MDTIWDGANDDAEARSSEGCTSGQLHRTRLKGIDPGLPPPHPHTKASKGASNNKRHEAQVVLAEPPNGCAASDALHFKKKKAP